jgi:hypothetical protein
MIACGWAASYLIVWYVCTYDTLYDIPISTGKYVVQYRTDQLRKQLQRHIKGKDKPKAKWQMIREQRWHRPSSTNPTRRQRG